MLLPVVKQWFESQEGRVIALIKPQFEAGRKAAAVHAGVILDEKVHQNVLSKTIIESEKLGFYVHGLIASPIQGPKGNVEFLVDLRLVLPSHALDIPILIEHALKMKPHKSTDSRH